MAKFTEEERIEKTIEIANYIIENNASTRKAAEHFGISNATVSDWMNLVLIKLDGKKYLKVQDILTGNKPKTIQDDFVKQRVLEAAELIKQNFTVEEIAKHYGVTVNVINEDLQTRLPRISQELYIEVKNKQSQNSKDNLKIGRNMSVGEQKRDENGKFTR